jgi:dTDP-4-amino-4,6-dideoxygalactose transaminase
MNVPLADLRLQYSSIKTDVDAAIQKVIDSSQFILGSAVSEFESSFAAAHGVRHCVAVGSGTDALHAALWAAGVGQGDLVATTPFTFIATVEAILLLKAVPVFIDIRTDSYTLDPVLLSRTLSEKKIKAVVPVHLYGQAADARPVFDIAERHGAVVVEDACQAHLARYDNLSVGHFGASACFSFYPGKNLGAFGEGGAVITDSDETALTIRRLRDHGQSAKYRHDFWGHNYRMDGIQGAVLGVKLRHLQAWTDRRRGIAARYRLELKNIGDIVLPFEDPKCYHVYHLFVIRTKHRDALQRFLSEQHIATGIAYPVPLHLQPAFSLLGYKNGDLPVSETVACECLALPMFAELTDGQQEYVVNAIRRFFSGR